MAREAEFRGPSREARVTTANGQQPPANGYAPPARKMGPMPNPEHVQSALVALGLPGSVRTFDETSTHTAQEAADAVGCELGQIVKTLFFVADGRPTMALVAGDRQVDTAALAQLIGVGRKKLKMGSPEEVRAVTGY